MKTNLSPETITEMYTQFEAMMWSYTEKAWTAVRKPCYYSKEDLFQEANIIFMEAVKKYMPSKGSFSTLLSRKLHNRFAWIVVKSYGYNDLNPAELTGQEVEIRGRTSPEYSKEITIEDINLVGSISAEARELINLVLSPPTDLLEMMLQHEAKADAEVTKTGNRAKATQKHRLSPVLREYMGLTPRQYTHLRKEILAKVAV